MKPRELGATKQQTNGAKRATMATVDNRARETSILPGKICGSDEERVLAISRGQLISQQRVRTGQKRCSSAFAEMVGGESRWHSASLSLFYHLSARPPKKPVTKRDHDKGKKVTQQPEFRRGRRDLHHS
jgi:hypothetical protein